LAVVAIAVVDGARTWQRHRVNLAISAGALPSESSNDAAELKFARAAAHAASGADDAALNRYRALQADATLGQSARYNSANALLRQGLRLRGGDQPGQAIPLIELAKETLREVLRQDPGHWQARYNLERAQRLLPDPDDADLRPTGAPSNAERAATTMRGYSPGLP
jgi:mxaK protein